MNIYCRSMKTKYSINWLAYILLIDMVLGGSGHLIEFGGISIRLIFLGSAILVGAVGTIRKNKINRLQVTAIFMILFYTFCFIKGWAYNNKDVSANLYLGYLTILVSFYFINCMNIYLMHKLIKLFRILSIILSLEIIVLWLYCWLMGPSNVYSYVNPVLIDKGIGFMDVLGKYPRIFFKDAVFVSIGMFFEVAEIFNNGYSINKIVPLIIYIVAIIFSFSSGFYLFSLIGVLVLLFLYHKISLKEIVIILVCFIIIFLINNKYGIMNILTSRYSEAYNPFYFRLRQFNNILSALFYSPIIGYGFGKEIMIEYGNYLKPRARFENQWGELLLCAGILGLLLYVYHIIQTCKMLKRKFKLNDKSIYIPLYTSIIFLCLLSFTNPYMNNAIGLVFYSICCGIASVDNKEIIKLC